MDHASKSGAVAWMAGAILSFLTMGVAGRALVVELSLFQILLYRNAICLLILGVLFTRVGWQSVRTPRPGRHLVRNLIHFAGQYAWFVAVVSIPLAEVFALEFTTPIWTAIFAVAFLGERFTSWRALAMALGFVGILVILRPGAAIIHPGALAAVAAAICFAVAYTITKNMVSYDRPLTILFWMHLVQLPLGLIPSLPVWVDPSHGLWPWIIAVGIAGFTSHYCISKAMACADAIVVVTVDFLRLPLGAVVAWLLYAEALEPLVMVGAVIVFAGVWINMRYG